MLTPAPPLVPSDSAHVTHEIVVVGAGVAGLTLARQLLARGRRPLVIERARGPGGRCATRRVDGQPVDHGIAFLHGRSSAFRTEVNAVRDVTRRDRWPVARDGDGSPCRPEAFAEHEHRVAFAEGVNRFARHLARGVDVRLATDVTSLRAPASGPGRTGWELGLASGERLRARAVALTMPAPSAVDLVRASAPLPGAIARVMPLLALVRTLPCLTVIARYAHATPAPEWDASFPASSVAIHSILHDSSKRVAPGRLMLVIQARPAYSRAHAGTSPDVWASALLREAADLKGDWIARPEAIHAHAWRKARVAPGAELTQPVAVRLDGGEVLGFAGDGFHPAGGIEGAYLSGLALADRFADLLDEPR